MARLKIKKWHDKLTELITEGNRLIIEPKLEDIKWWPLFSFLLKSPIFPKTIGFGNLM